jgi:hypothetical protein
LTCVIRSDTAATPQHKGTKVEGYAARRRRVIVKSETSRRGFNTRNVVTSLRGGSADLFPGCLRLSHINRPADREVLTLDFLHVSRNTLQSLARS